MENKTEPAKIIGETDLPNSPIVDSPTSPTSASDSTVEQTGQCYWNGQVFSSGIYCLNGRMYNCMNGVWNSTGTNC